MRRRVLDKASRSCVGRRRIFFCVRGSRSWSKSCTKATAARANRGAVDGGKLVELHEADEFHTGMLCSSYHVLLCPVYKTDTTMKTGRQLAWGVKVCKNQARKGHHRYGLSPEVLEPRREGGAQDSCKSFNLQQAAGRFWSASTQRNNESVETESGCRVCGPRAPDVD